MFVSPTSCRLPLAGSEAAGSGSEFLLRAEFDIIPMPWDWPAEVNYHEARAFLNWKGTQDGKAYRMPTVSSPRTHAHSHSHAVQTQACSRAYTHS